MKSFIRYKNIYIIVLIYFIFYLICISKTLAQDNCNDQAIYFREKGKFYKFSLVQKKASEINQREYLLNTIVASPDSQWVAESPGVFVNAKGERMSLDLPKNRIESVWSPKADMIAYITGSWGGGWGDEAIESNGPPGCRGSCPDPGVWIYDIKTHTKQRIDLTAYDLAWPAFDGNLYINTDWMEPTYKEIYVYNPDTKKLDKTPYKGLCFSPNGKYYYMESKEGEPIHLFQREPHKELKELAREIEDIANPTHYYWLGDDSLLLPAKNQSSKKFIIYDIEKGNVRKTIEGALLGLNKNKTKVLVMKGKDQFEVIDILPSE